MRAQCHRLRTGVRLAPLLAAGEVCLLAVLSTLAAARSTGRAGGGPVYTVAVMDAHLTQDPRRWVGRTLLVRGEVAPCLAVPSVGDAPCAALVPSGWQPSSPAPQGAAADPLPVVHGGLDPFLARVRRLLLLGALLPAPQVLRWGAVATYRVRLRTSANSSCGTDVCYEALLLNATPGSL